MYLSFFCVCVCMCVCVVMCNGLVHHLVFFYVVFEVDIMFCMLIDFVLLDYSTVLSLIWAL